MLNKQLGSRWWDITCDVTVMYNAQMVILYLTPWMLFMMTSSNGNMFRVTGHLCGEFTGLRWIPHTKASDAELYVFFDFRLNKRISKHSWGWWFETQSRSLWRHRNEMIRCKGIRRVLISKNSQNLKVLAAKNRILNTTKYLYVHVFYSLKLMKTRCNYRKWGISEGNSLWNDLKIVKRICV